MYAEGPYIRDDTGRTLVLRGCNLGGSSKLPASPPEAACQGPLSLNNYPELTFAGRPFPLSESEDHFKRLKSWGLNFIRMIITWEALEHSGPGIYDEAYLAYLRKILLAAEKEGISVFLDPHQDVWSRWTGGDGAPAWTLEKLGMDLEKLDAAGAAVTFQHYRNFRECRAYWGKGGTTKLFWPVNYSRYAPATLFTLFFGGHCYAPDLKIDGVQVQDWLQEHYIAAFRHCYRRLKNCRALIGWGVFNEPNPGFIGCRDITKLEDFTLSLGPMPSPWESMQAAAGKAVKTASYIPFLKGPLKTGSVTLNPDKVPLFREGYTCPWKQAGVWIEEGSELKIIKKDHFAKYEGRPAHFTEDFLKPFLRKFIDRMKEADRPALFFIEGIAHREHPLWSAADGEGAVNAFHHYDGLTLFSKSYKPWFAADEVRGKIYLGRKKAAAFYASRLKDALDWSREKMGNIPCLLGEFGLPFDLDRKKAYKTGDYRIHEEALSRYYDGVDRSLLHSTIWNYTADNTHEEGDRWNGEDLSIVCQGVPRAQKGWMRPYAMATAGTPLLLSWDTKKAVLRYCFRADPLIKEPTEIFAPREYFGSDPVITISSPLKAQYLPEQNRILIQNEGFEGEAELIVRPKEPGGLK